MKLWKAFAILSGLAAVAHASSQVAFDANTAPALDQDIIDRVNAGNHGWKAGRNSKFEGMTVAEAASRFLRTMLPESADPTSVPQVQFHAKDLPDNFDSREQWKGCVHPIRNQQQCGSCWAFAASEVLSDRFCIASNGKVDVVLSPEDLVSCDTANYGCNGGYIDKSWTYLENKGIPSDACYPYTSGNGITGKCNEGSCADGSDWKVYKAQSGSSKRLVDAKSIQTDIQANGPVEAGFMVYQDFFSYSSGVYSHQYGGLAGGHAIKIVGWGVDSGSQQPYWIVANSWGEDWGIKGYFWILRGSDECGIEDQVYAGLPALN